MASYQFNYDGDNERLDTIGGDDDYSDEDMNMEMMEDDDSDGKIDVQLDDLPDDVDEDEEENVDLLGL